MRRMESDARRSNVYAMLGYVAAAALFAGPLLPRIHTHLTGDPAGDTGVYVWNLWVFQHELLDQHRFPYFTDTILKSGDLANLSLHNYTLFQNVLALPLIPLVGIIASFNIVTLLMQVITAYATYLLARRALDVVGRDASFDGAQDSPEHGRGAQRPGGLAMDGWRSRPAEAWLAGLLFAWSPVLVARGTAHFSLVAAAPLAVFLVCLLRLDDNVQRRARLSIRLAAALGVSMWWAASTDVYYAVYCLLIAATYLACRVVTIAPASSPRRGIRLGLDVAIAMIGALVVAIAWSGGWQVTIAGLVVSMRTAYTPLLALTALLVVRFAVVHRFGSKPVSRVAVGHLVATTVIGAGVASVLLAPVLYAMATRIAAGQFEVPPLLWRSSPPGIDVVSLLLPNPGNPFTPGGVAAWLAARPNGLIENAASIPLVALAALFFAWRAGWRPPRLWAGLSIVFGLLALGPFVHIAGLNTQVPGPWALLRYVPIIGLARSPTRMAIVLTLAVAVLFAIGLAWLGDRYPRRRRVLLAATGVLLALELLPSPRPLHSASIPRIYQQVAAAAPGVELLELPFGIRDGASSVGNATARTQFFQTAHGKSIQGGYLSRISRSRIAAARRDVVLDTLLTLSEGQAITGEQQRRFVQSGEAYIRKRNIGFVVIDRLRTPAALRLLAIETFRLRMVESDGVLELHVPVQQ
jgi:hypothetical protein